MAGRIKEIERERGKTLKEVLIEDFPKYGSLAGLARGLGVRPSTVNYWLLRYGLQLKTELVEWERGA